MAKPLMGLLEIWRSVMEAQSKGPKQSVQPAQPRGDMEFYTGPDGKLYSRERKDKRPIVNPPQTGRRG